MKKKLLYTFAALSVCCTIVITSCSKFVEPSESKSQIETNIVFSDSTIAASAILGAYFTLGTPTNSTFIYSKNLSQYGDEYTYTPSTTIFVEYNQSLLPTDNSQNSALWNSLYSVIYQCNTLIEGVDRSNGLSAKAASILKAEARFLRAYAYFYLVNLYDHVPLILTADVNQNRRALQALPQMVYDQIVADLRIAKSDLGPDYIGTGKVRANSKAASALLARVYLYQGRWNDAEKEATVVIGSGMYNPLPRLEDVFLANSKEAILQFWNPNGFVGDAASLLPASSTILPQYTISSGLYEAFEMTDGRKTKWISTNNVTTNGVTKPYQYPAKYKNRVANTSRPEYVMALRLSEQYLIRAEALAQQDHVQDAVADLNMIRSRAELLPLPNTISKETCLDAIARERRLELFGEWGHRFMDLKRTGQLDAVLGTLKTTWRPDVAKAFPIPNTEIIYNSNLIQNHGY